MIAEGVSELADDFGVRFQHVGPRRAEETGVVPVILHALAQLVKGLGRWFVANDFEVAATIPEDALQPFADRLESILEYRPLVDALVRGGQLGGEAGDSAREVVRLCRRSPQDGLHVAEPSFQ